MAAPRSLARREYLWSWGIIIGGGILHLWWHQWLVSLILAPVFTSLALTWILRHPGPTVVGLALIFELLGTSLPGIVLAACFVPLLARRIAWRVEPDASFRFVLVLGATAAVQLVLVAAPGSLSTGAFPLAIVWPTWLASSSAAFVVIGAYYYGLPGSIGQDISGLRGYGR